MLLLLVVLSTAGTDQLAVDMVEYNTTVNPETGEVIYRQVIFWDEYFYGRGYHCRGYHLAHPAALPLPNNAGYVLRFKKWDRLHEVRAKFVRYTVTGYDPEQEDAKAWRYRDNLIKAVEFAPSFFQDQ